MCAYDCAVQFQRKELTIAKLFVHTKFEQLLDQCEASECLNSRIQQCRGKYCFRMDNSLEVGELEDQ